MSNYTIRPLTLADAPQAAALWSLVFGDEESLVLEFFRIFAHTPHFGFCAERNGILAAAAYCPSGTDFVTAAGDAHSGAYLYAVATHPAHRKQGLAAELCLQLKARVFAAGCSHLFTKPSEESLYPWYEEKIGAVPTMGMQSITFDRTDTECVPVRPLTPDAYLLHREDALRGQPYVRHSAEWMEWESLLHTAYGGGFCAVGNLIADYFSDGSTLQINELLPHPTAEEAEQAAQALMYYTGTTHCTVTLYGEAHYVSAVTQDEDLPTGWFGVCYG
jgi:GNAT superfamily N-acetyltransferase